MTNSYRIQHSAGDVRIDYQGHLYAEDELNEAIWLVNIELRNGLPKRERIEARHQIAELQTLLDALQRAGAGA